MKKTGVSSSCRDYIKRQADNAEIIRGVMNRLDVLANIDMISEPIRNDCKDMASKLRGLLP